MIRRFGERTELCWVVVCNPLITAAGGVLQVLLLVALAVRHHDTGGPQSVDLSDSLHSVWRWQAS
jgi:hypothetical protein